MRNFSIFFFIAALLFVPSSTLLRRIDFPTLDKLISENKWLVVLLFHTNGCSACEIAKTEFTRASDHFVNQERVYFAEIDIEKERLLAMRFQVESVPLVKYLPYSQVAIGLRGGLNEANIVKVIRGAQTAGRMQPLNQHGANNSSVEKIISAKLIRAVEYDKVVMDTSVNVFLALFVPGCMETCNIFDKAAQIFENEEHILLVKLDVSEAPEIANHFLATRNPTIVWFPRRNKEYGQRYDNEDLNIHDLVSFINDNCGTQRQTDGKLAKNAGRIPVLDKIIHENIVDIVTARYVRLVIDLIKDESESLPHDTRYIDYYIHILTEIEDGKEAIRVLEKENEKAMKKLNDDKVSASLKDKWRKYFNIISSFVESAAEKLKTEHLEAEEKILQQNQKPRRMENIPQSTYRGNVKTRRTVTLGQRRVHNEL